MDEQAPLLELPEQPEKIVPRGAEPATPAAPRFAELDRTQLRWVELDLENLVGADHLARAIWDLVGKLDLTAFEAGYASREGRAGRPGWPPRALISIWIYAYSQGIASARAVERMMAWEPGLRWLAADQVISHHTLSDFRVSEQERLAKLFEDVLGVMQSEELLDLSTILQDGTKVRARASKGSLHRRQRLEEHCAEARAVVAELERQGEQEAVDVRRQAARKRAAQDRVERMKAALEELTEREREAGPARRKELRVSESEPEARKMKHADGSWAPSYNVQVQTEARSRMVVGIEVTQAANDAEQLVGGLEQVEQNTGVKPERMIADGG
jgi:transposase